MRHLTQLELARRWALSPRTLEAWRWRGQGPRYLKIGKRIVYRLDDVEAHETKSLHEGASGTAGPARGRGA